MGTPDPLQTAPLSIFFHTIDNLLPYYRISLLCLLSPARRKVPRDQESGFCSVMYSNFAEWCVSFSRCSINAKWCSRYGEHYGGSSETKTHDSATPLPGIYLDKIIIQRDTCTPMFRAVLFTIAKTWKPPKCLLIDEWIKKMWCICTTEY